MNQPNVPQTPDVPKTEAQWKAKLSPLEFQVLRRAATERPGTGALLAEERPGTYSCKGCGQKLFEASTKFDAGCGWPSFFQALPGATTEDTDYLLGYPRTEIRCSSCDSHLGHVFPDAPGTPTGLRYCMNSVALDFEPSHFEPHHAPSDFTPKADLGFESGRQPPSWDKCRPSSDDYPPSPWDN